MSRGLSVQACIWVLGGSLMIGCSDGGGSAADVGVDVISPDTGVERDIGVVPDEGVEPDVGVEPDIGVDGVVLPDVGLDAPPPDVGVDAPPVDLTADVAVDLAADVSVDAAGDLGGDASADLAADTVSTDSQSPTTSDQCASPATIQLATSGPTVVSGDTTGAANEFGTSISCGLFSFDGPQVYYEVSLTGGNSYKIEVVPTTAWDVAVYAFTDTTCDATTIDTECADAAADGGGSGDPEVVVITPAASGTYIIAVDSALASDSGPFTLTIDEFTGPPNGICARPEQIFLTPGQTSTTQGDTTGAANEFGTAISCGMMFTFDGAQLYYSVDLDAGKNYKFEVTPTGGWDPAIYLFTDDTCTAATIETECTSMVADDGYGGDAEVVFVAPSVAATYYVAIDTGVTGDFGAFTLTIDEYTPPGNDTCANATGLTFNASNVATATGDNSAAINDVTLSSTSCAGALGIGTPGGDVFYSVALISGETYTVELQPNGTQDPSLYVFTDCADPDTTCVDGADSGLDGDPETVTITPSADQTYYIGVDAWSSTEFGSFTLTVTKQP